jgi:hypothetical protein
MAVVPLALAGEGGLQLLDRVGRGLGGAAGPPDEMAADLFGGDRCANRKASW